MEFKLCLLNIVLLFVDDVGFSLKDPVNLLKALQLVLTRFGEISGCKVNEVKSTRMGLNIDTATRDQLRTFNSTPWKSTVKYLGINLRVPLGKGPLT